MSFLFQVFTYMKQINITEGVKSKTSLKHIHKFHNTYHLNIFKNFLNLITIVVFSHDLYNLKISLCIHVDFFLKNTSCV